MHMHKYVYNCHIDIMYIGTHCDLLPNPVRTFSFFGKFRKTSKLVDVTLYIAQLYLLNSLLEFQHFLFKVI